MDPLHGFGASRNLAISGQSGCLHQEASCMCGRLKERLSCMSLVRYQRILQCVEKQLANKELDLCGESLTTWDPLSFVFRQDAVTVDQTSKVTADEHQ